MANRSEWNSVMTFLMAMIGLTIGIGNIWRFSYIVYGNGGGSFFIPYLFAIFVMGIPFLIMEYGLGFSFKENYSKLMSEIRPEFEIIAWMLVLFVFIIAIYYMVLLGWDLVYLVNSINFGWGSGTSSFFISNVGGSADFSNIATVIMPTLISIIVLWIIFWTVSNRDVADGIGKLSNILIPLLFIIMGIIVIYSITLPGSFLGIKTLFTPDWSALFNINIWLAAFGQTIFTLSIGQAMVYTYASYLSEKSKLIDEVLIVVAINTIYEIFIAIGVFSILGYMSTASSIPINELVNEGTGLIFIVFTQVFNMVGWTGRIIAPLFFISILFAGLTSAFALFEPLLSSLCGKFGWSRRKGVTILTVIACLCSCIFSLGIGDYLVELVDRFVTSFGILILIGVQAIIFGWFYDLKKIIPSLNELSTFKVGKTWMFIIKYILPVIIIMLWIFGLINSFSQISSFEAIIDLIMALVVVALSIVFTKAKAHN